MRKNILQYIALAFVVLICSTGGVTSKARAEVFVETGPGWSSVTQTAHKAVAHLNSLPGIGGIGLSSNSSLSMIVQVIRSRRGLSGVAIVHDRWLDVLDRNSLITAIDSFDHIDRAFKRLDANDRSKAVWVALGWILLDNLKPFREKGKCDPNEDWKDDQCTEQLDKESYVVKIKAGHKGWPIHGFAIARTDTDADIVRTIAVTLSSTQWSELIRDDYLIVPADSVRTKRSVTFELYNPKTKKLVKSVSGTDAKPDLLIENADKDGGYNSCGGKASACPMFNVPPDVMKSLIKTLPTKP